MKKTQPYPKDKNSYLNKMIETIDDYIDTKGVQITEIEVYYRRLVVLQFNKTDQGVKSLRLPYTPECLDPRYIKKLVNFVISQEIFVFDNYATIHSLKSATLRLEEHRKIYF